MSDKNDSKYFNIPYSFTQDVYVNIYNNMNENIELALYFLNRHTENIYGVNFKIYKYEVNDISDAYNAIKYMLFSMISRGVRESLQTCVKNEDSIETHIKIGYNNIAISGNKWSESIVKIFGKITIENLPSEIIIKYYRNILQWKEDEIEHIKYQ